MDTNDGFKKYLTHIYIDNPSQEKIISDSESLGSQDSWSTENSYDSQNSFICEDNYTTDEEFWNVVDNVDEKRDIEKGLRE